MGNTPVKNIIKKDPNVILDKSSKKLRRNGCAIVLLFFIALVGSSIYAFQNADKLGATPKGDFANATNITTDQAVRILEILKKCGIEKIDLIKHDDALDNINKESEKGYRVSSGDINNIIVYILSDGTLNMVRWSDNNLYANSKIVSKITDYVLTLSEMSIIQNKCQEAIKSILKSPATAKFPNINNWVFNKKNEVITVQSYVDSQNSFGANIRGDFQFKIKDNIVISLIFEKKEYIK